MCAHFKFFGSKHKPDVTPTEENNKIPSGLPTTSPRIIPYELEWFNPSCQFSVMVKAVLATAKRGRIKKATG